jgi:Phosphorylase superfamily
MTRATILVPRGAEAAAVRRGAREARIVEIPAGAAAASELPAFAPGEIAVVLGLCGALRDLGVGDVAIYRTVRDPSKTIALDPPTIAALAARLPHARIVDACASDHVVTTRAERRALAARYDADVVDMEAAHLAWALTVRGVSYAMVRVVSDDAARELPALGDAIAPDGTIRPARIALAFARRPLAAFAFVRNVRTALTALSALARGLSSS